MVCPMRTVAGMWFFLLRAVVLGESESALDLTDPAPPRFHSKPASIAEPAPRSHAGWIQYRKAGPLARAALVDDWPCFLGPTRDGTTRETRLLTTFSPLPQGRSDPLLLWSSARGESYTAPSIRGSRLIHFYRQENREVADCLQADSGKRYWSIAYPTTYRDRFGYLNGPRASPATDGDRVFTLGAQGVLQCLDLPSGHLYWRRQLAKEFTANEGFFGFSCSPLIEGDLVIINLGLGRCVAAFEKQSGALKWISGTQWGRSYATPVAATQYGKRKLFVFAGGMTNPPVGGLLCLDPVTGSIHFRFPWRSKRQFSVNASTPVVSGNRVFISSSYDVHGAMLEIKPDFTLSVVYRTKAYSSHWATPVLHNGHLYGFSNNKLTCMDWKTGERLWRKTINVGDEFGQDVTDGEGLRSPTARGAERYRDTPGKRGFGIGSLIRADGRFLCLGETGLVAWLDLSPEGCRILSGRRLFDAQQTWTAPVLSRGLLYIAQNHVDGDTLPRLLCYDLREP